MVGRKIGLERVKFPVLVHFVLAGGGLLTAGFVITAFAIFVFCWQPNASKEVLLLSLI
jgi:hypothetical protein